MKPTKSTDKGNGQEAYVEVFWPDYSPVLRCVIDISRIEQLVNNKEQLIRLIDSKLSEARNGMFDALKIERRP